MISIQQEVDGLTIGEAARFRNLAVFRIFRRQAAGTGSDYVLFEDAVRQGLARAGELDGGGSVGELLLENRGERPVLMLDGEELIGARQNRVVNLTILAPPKQTLVIPVSCVEAGRWHMMSADFRRPDHMMFTSARAGRAAAVTASMRSRGTRQSDQSAIWGDIESMACRMEAPSPTQAMAAMYERHSLSVEEYVRAFAWRDGQTGAAFAIGGHVRGLDLFDLPETMRRVFPKLVRSYALDALDAGAMTRDAEEKEVLDFLARLASAPVFVEPAVGLGKDVRVAGQHVSGAALWAEGRYVHLCAFAANGGKDRRGFSTRMSRPSQRRVH